MEGSGLGVEGVGSVNMGVGRSGFGVEGESVSVLII